MAHPLVTADLVTRLEAAEIAYTEAKLRASRDDDGNSRGAEIARAGHSVLLSIQSRRNNPSVNRAMGFTAQALEHLDEILIAYTKLLYAPREPGTRT